MRRKDKHILRESPPPPNVYFTCPRCSNVFNQSCELRSHLTSCKAKMTRIVETNPGMKSYIRPAQTKKKVRKVQCRFCLLSFQAGNCLTEHERVHTGEKPYKCSTCGRSFARKYAFTLHLRIHTGEKPYACGVCGKRFTSYSSLRWHLRMHQPKPGKAFGQFNYNYYNSTDRPITSINGKKRRRYFCPICPANFSLKIGLLRHTGGHSEDGPYKCKICSYSAFQNYILKRHLRHHKAETPKKKRYPYMCKICGGTFSLRNYFEQHLRGHEELSINNRKYGSDHQSHKINSAQPDRILTSEIMNTENPHECITCGNSFTCRSILNRHLRRTGHASTEMIIYSCKECESCFIQDEDLCLHYSRHHKLPVVRLQNLMLNVGDIVVLDD